MKLIRTVIKDINEKKISNYNDTFKVVITASKENISKIKGNTEEYYDELDRLREENYSLIEKKEYLENLLESSSLNLVYDDNGNIVGINDDNYEEEIE